MVRYFYLTTPRNPDPFRPLKSITTTESLLRTNGPVDTEVVLVPVDVVVLVGSWFFLCTE